jgi:uncharacterized protein (DUF1778 family)
MGHYHRLTLMEREELSRMLAAGYSLRATAHAKEALRLALALQHRRTADFRMAALCAEATNSVVNILAVLVGRRGRG